MRGLSAAVTLALGLWIFGQPMPGMTMGGGMPMTAAAAHVAGGHGHAPHADGRCGLCFGCCPGSAAAPPNPAALRFDAPAAPDAPAPSIPVLPRRPFAFHWQPLPIGPPAPPVS